MSDHQFERQVQQKMDELKLRPSDSVWESVEKELDREKRRRRTLWWVPALLLLCGAGGMIVFQNTKNHSENVVAKLSQKQSEPKPGAKATAPEQKEAAASTQKPGSTNSEDSKTSEANTKEVKAETNQNEIQADQKLLPENSISHTGVTENNKSRIPTQRLASNTSGRRQKPGKTGDRNIIDEKVPSEDEVALTGKSLNGDLLAEPARLQPESPYKNFSKSTATASLRLSELPAVEKPESLWGFGLHAYGGVSNVNEADAFDYSTSAQMTPVFSGSLLPVNGLVYKPSSIKKGPAFTFGAFAQRKISKRLSLTVGIDYTEFSTYSEVGTPTNMVWNQRSMLYLNSFYSPGTTEKYHNRYQFLELPVTVQYQVNKSEKLPISLNAGVAVSRLLTTNALHYDSFTGSYYSDNNLFNRTHFMVAGGASISVLNKTHLPLSIGPLFRYQVSNLVKKDVTEGKHLLSAGLSVRMTWKKEVKK